MRSIEINKTGNTSTDVIANIIIPWLLSRPPLLYKIIPIIIAANAKITIDKYPI